MRGQRSGVLTTRRMELTLRVLKRARHHTIGGHHEVLDQFRGTILFPRVDAPHLAVGKHRLGLHAIEVQCAHLDTFVTENLRGLVLQLQLRRQFGGRGHFRRRRGSPLQPRPHAVVGQLRLIAHQRPIDARG